MIDNLNYALRGLEIIGTGASVLCAVLLAVMLVAKHREEKAKKP